MYKSSKQRKQNIKVRARMPYLRGRMCRRDRGCAALPENEVGEGKEDKISAYSLQLLSYEAWEPRSLCFPTRHPSPCFSFFSLQSSSFESFENFCFYPSLYSKSPH